MKPAPFPLSCVQLHPIPFLLPAQILLWPLDQTSQLTKPQKTNSAKGLRIPCQHSKLTHLTEGNLLRLQDGGSRSVRSRSVLPGSRKTLAILSIWTGNHCRRKRKKEQRSQCLLHQMEQRSEEEERMADFYNNALGTKPLAAIEMETVWIQGPEHNLIVDYWLKHTGLLHYKDSMLCLHTKVSQLALLISSSGFLFSTEIHGQVIQIQFITKNTINIHRAEARHY